MHQIDIDSELCIGCRACAITCPEGVLDILGDYCAIVIDLGKCISCMLCEEVCPENAIEVRTE